jgi:hypothetical protein
MSTIVVLEYEHEELLRTINASKHERTQEAKILRDYQELLSLRPLPRRKGKTTSSPGETYDLSVI